MASEKGAPSTDNLVALIKVNNNGKRIGNDKTGYSVPFVFAFEMIAAKIVEALASPNVPSTIIGMKIE